MNKEQQEILDDAFSQFRKYKMENLYDTRWDVIIEMNTSDNTKPYFATGRRLSQEEFINKCKTNKEFSEMWGLRIKERELKKNSGWERYELLLKRISEKELQEKYKDDERATWLGFKKFTLVNANYICDKENIPTKLITITYNDKTIESYE